MHSWLILYSCLKFISGERKGLTRWSSPSFPIGVCVQCVQVSQGTENPELSCDFQHCSVVVALHYCPVALLLNFERSQVQHFCFPLFFFFFPPHYFSLWMLIITHSWTYYFQFLNLPFSYLLCPRFPKGKKKRAFQLFLLIPFASYLYS